MHRLLLFLAGSAALLAGAAAAGAPPACVGFAPLLSECHLGEHGADAGFVVTFPECGEGVAAPTAVGPCFVGDLQVVHSSPFGERRSTCSLVIVEVPSQMACTGSGSFNLGPRISLACYARAYGTMDPAVAGSGERGALGSWGCQVR